MNREFLKLAIPNIISNISVPLLSSVDTILMGHISQPHLAALGIASMIFVFIYGNFSFLRAGTTGMTAQAYGSQNLQKISNTLFRAIFLGFGLGVLILIFQNQILNLSSYLMNIDNSYALLVNQYFSIRIYTAPAVLISYAIMGWFFGMQNATYPLIITIFINIVNIILSYYFVKVANLGVQGVAYGTLIAQYSGLVLSLFLLLKYKSSINKTNLKQILHYHQLLEFLHVNKNIFIRTLSLTFVLAFFYSQSAKNSQETLAVMILLLQFLIWFSFSIDGVAYATESLVGKYYGAKDWKNFYKAIRYSFYWGVGFTFLYMILYYKETRELLELYTNQTNLIDKSMEFLPWIVLMPLISFGAFIWDGVFIGMTAVKSMRNSVLLSTILFLTIFYTTKEYNFIYSLWISFLLFFALRGLIQTFLFLKQKTKLK